MKKSILFLGLVSALALVGVLAWSLRGERSLELSHLTPERDASVAHFEPDADAEVEAAAPAQLDVRETAVPAADGPTILVVERESGRALAGAELIWARRADAGGSARLNAKLESFFDAQARARDGSPAEKRPVTLVTGRRFTTDAEGRARVPHCDDTALVVVHHGVLTGSVELAADERGVVRVELAATDDLVVRVLTAEGEPAPGIDVSVGIGDDEGVVGGVALTDASGRARLVHLARHAQGAAAELPLVLIADVPLVTTLVRPLARADLDVQLVELRLPPTGSLAVRVKNADGTVPRPGSLVHVSAASGAGTSRTVTNASRSPNVAPFGADASASVVDGVARFERVGLGRRWRASYGGSGFVSGISEEVAGPRNAGETVAVELDYARQPIVACKLLDVDGTPYARHEIRGQLSQRGRTDDGALTSDAQGRVRLALSTDPVDIARRTLTLTFDDREKVELDLSREFPAGVTELPDVQLEEKPLLASGRVVGARGEPVANAQVRVERRLRDAQSGEAELWQGVRELDARSRADGSFVVHGAAGDSQLGLRASTSNGLVAAERVEFAPGQRGIELRVVAPGGVSARVRGPAELELDQLSARLALADAPAATSDASTKQRVEVGADGGLLAGGLMPGRWELVIGASLNSELAHVDDIVVEPGGTTDAGVIDLSARLVRVRLVVVDETGKRLGNATARCLTPNLRSRRPVQSEMGVFEYLVPAEGCDVNVECEGHRGVTLTNVRADQHVVLQSGVSVRVRALGRERLGTDELKLGVQFEFDGSDAQGASARGRMFGGTFDAGREFTAIAPFEGPYRAWWTVEMQRGTGWAVRQVSVPSTERFVIERGQNGTVIELAVPPGLLDDAALSVKERDESGATKTAPVKIEPPRRG